MKIIFFCNEASFINSHRLDLIKFLIDKSFKIKIVTYLNEKIKISHIEKINFNIKSGLSILKNITTIIFFRNLIKQNNDSIVHSIGLKSNILVLLSSLNLNNKIILHFTGLGIVFSNKRLILLKYIIKIIIKIFFFKKNLYFIFQKKEDAIHLGLAKHLNNNIKIFIIPGSGVDTRQYNQIKIKKKNTLNILMASRVIKYKGIERYLSLVSKLQNNKSFKFFFAGKYEKKFNSFDIKYLLEQDSSNFQYLGFVENMKKLLQKMDVIYYPSVYGEGIPKFLLEVISSGIPVICSNTIANKYVVKHNKNGYVSDNLEQDYLFLNKLLNIEKRLKFSIFARNLSCKKYDINIINTLHLDIYLRLIK